MKFLNVRLILFFTLAIYVFIVFNRQDQWTGHRALIWDKANYYLYLPGIFIHHDIEQYAFYPQANAQYGLTPGDNLYGLHKQSKTGRYLNQYPVGVAIMQAPLFFAAHAATRLSGAYPADGYTDFYQLAVFLSGIGWVILGLFWLSKLLRRYYSEGITLILILLLAFGTNLYHYTAFDPGMSHPFGFTMFAAALLCADSFYQRRKLRDALLLGLVTGMAVIMRPTNGLILLPVLLWQVDSIAALRSRFRLLWQGRRSVMLSMLVFCSVVMILIGYWKWATGDWLHDTYENQPNFIFSNPQIWNGLFSYKKGWFVYTPLAFFGVLGLIRLFFKNKGLFWPIFLFLVINIYVVFSWANWWYGGSFGCRATIESLVLLAFPLGSLIAWIAERRRAWITGAATVVLLFITVLNLFQTYQYSFNTIHYDSMNKQYYWAIFGKVLASEEDWKLLSQ